MKDKLDPDVDEGDSETRIRIQKLLAMAGAGSRRHCEEFITTGRVTVDGRTVVELGAKVNPEAQDVRLDGERVRCERKVHYLLNKPPGYLCTNRDPDGRPRVVDLFPGDRERLFTVGRLDEHSQGLILVTNDGELAHRLAHPRFRVRKVYRVQVAGVPSREIVTQLTQGMYFAEGRFKATEARLVKTKGQSAQLEIVLTEGQNREIRRLLAKLGHKVQRLVRVALGPLTLGALEPGTYRPLTTAEVRELRELAFGRRSGLPGQRAGQRGRMGKKPVGRRDRKSSAPSAAHAGRPPKRGSRRK